MPHQSALEKEIRKHNKRVNDAFRRAEQGETINLTDLMISKERIDEKVDPLLRAFKKKTGGI